MSMDFIQQAFNHIEPTDLSLEDIIMWDDNDWCYRYELTDSDRSLASDRHQVIPFASSNYLDIVGAQ